mmetsp:Transcript_43268/g.89207  ORF Transcript_43268/g.89207 Transcript_43268/m.89207 type:complete len:145 (-) Transcript_43268:17-451(-)
MPGEGFGYIKSGSLKRGHFVDREAQEIDVERLDATLGELAASVKAAKWTADGSTLTAPGGFKMQCYTEVEEEEDYLIAIQTPEHSLVVGNLGCHPFVELEWMSFGNSDGSTDHPVPEKAVTKNAVKLCTKAIGDARTFIFHQVH